MKILHIIIFFVTLKSTLYSQIDTYDMPLRTLNIKCNPFTVFQGPIMFVSEYRLGFEKPIATFSTIQIMGSYLSKAPYVYYFEAVNNMNDYLIIEGYRMQIEYKNYFLGRKHGNYPFEGFYWSINGSYAHASITNSYYSLKGQKISATYQYLALKLGYQYAFNHYTFDFFYGMGYRNINWHSNIPNSGIGTLNKKDFVPFDTPIKILLGLNIGYRL